MPSALTAYPPHVVAMLLAGGPLLLERLLDEAALRPEAPRPAMVAHLLQAHELVPVGTRVGNCSPPEPPPMPSRPSSRLLRDASRRGWGAPGEEDEEEEEEDDGWEAERSDEADDARGGTESAPPRKAKLRTYPRGSPPPRDARAGAGRRRRR